MNKYVFIMYNKTGIMQVKWADTEEEAIAEQDAFYISAIKDGKVCLLPSVF